ncbi:hypothetical protein E1H12_21600 [Geitlerinema sp. P-1104]|uniref:hypothetical protein n=1 Tax=Geitlerinema sp. P-1104 TaxID=2546230 RepID=UPI00147764C0|nr:hypothetical protein [Geitlerinema sp. P-1104]NMG61034.1 hypothetical protein [Geitlerinema sp. P-1104]
MNLQHTLGCAALSLSFAGLSLLTAAPAEAFTLTFENGDGFEGNALANVNDFDFEFLAFDGSSTFVDGDYGNFGIMSGTGNFAPYITFGGLSEGLLIKSADFAAVTSVTDFMQYDESITNSGKASWAIDISNIKLYEHMDGNEGTRGITADATFRSGNTVKGVGALSTQFKPSISNPRAVSIGAKVDVPEPTGIIGAGIAVTMMAGLRKRAKQNA